MKYRIIKHGNGDPYYIAQYEDEQNREWRTIEMPFRGVRGSKAFKSRRDALKALRNIARTQLERSQVRIIEEGVL